MFLRCFHRLEITMKYKRVLIKLSGEALKGDSSQIFDPELLKNVAKVIREVSLYIMIDKGHPRTLILLRSKSPPDHVHIRFFRQYRRRKLNSRGIFTLMRYKADVDRERLPVISLRYCRKKTSRVKECERARIRRDDFCLRCENDMKEDRRPSGRVRRPIHCAGPEHDPIVQHRHQNRLRQATGRWRTERTAESGGDFRSRPLHHGPVKDLIYKLAAAAE